MNSDRYCPQCDETYCDKSKCPECHGALIERDQAMHQKIQDLSKKLGKAARPNQAYDTADEADRRKIFLTALLERAQRNQNYGKARLLRQKIESL